MSKSRPCKDRLVFQVNYAKLWYGNGPFGSQFIFEQEDELDPNEEEPKLYFELRAEHHNLYYLLGKRPATALIERHHEGKKAIATELPTRGLIYIGNREGGEGVTRHGYIDILGFLPPRSFDAISYALITGGTEILSRLRLQIQTREDLSKFNFDGIGKSSDSTMFVIDDIAISLEIGNQ